MTVIVTKIMVPSAEPTVGRGVVVCVTLGNHPGRVSFTFSHGLRWAYALDSAGHMRKRYVRLNLRSVPMADGSTKASRSFEGSKGP